ncbi:hypothetical protein BRY73_16015 [Ochrobactrum sp. P6BS-III]|nr:hypothetical protein [Ochrobactrum sp. P6BSIII]OOL15975.1 hypothetical protein BRY73_16015 [Ochrobactrum sp. P6BS-III]
MEEKPRMMVSQPWTLRRITRIEAGLHELIFDVDEQPSIKLTIEGSFSLKSLRVEGVATPA